VREFHLVTVSIINVVATVTSSSVQHCSSHVVNSQRACNHDRYDNCILTIMSCVMLCVTLLTDGVAGFQDQ